MQIFHNHIIHIYFIEKRIRQEWSKRAQTECSEGAASARKSVDKIVVIFIQTHKMMRALWCP